MEPLLSFGGLELSLVEIILLLVFALIGAIIASLVAGRRKDPEAALLAAQMREKLTEMQAQQGALQGRLAQFAEDSAQRDTLFRESLDERLTKVSERVGKSIVDTQERNSANLKQLHERLALIDRAQKNIETLSGEVSGLQSLLSNKQARGAFGEKQMQDLIKAFLPSRTYSFQHTLSNRTRVDAVIFMPEGHGHVAIDSKFPMESWRKFISAEEDFAIEKEKRAFQNDVLKHVKDISSKYLIAGETYELALLFLPSDAIFSELHSNFEDVVNKSFNQRVVIVSPTTFMATLHTIQAVMNDADIQKNAGIIKKEVSQLHKDVERLDIRVTKLQRHFEQAQTDMKEIKTSTGRITSRAKKIKNVEFGDDDQNLSTNDTTPLIESDET